MKKLLFVLFALVFVACGSKSPEGIANKFYEGIFKGDVDSVVECFEYEKNTKEAVKGKISMMVLSANEMAKKKGGFKSVKSEVLEKDDKKAKVKSQLSFKDGSIKDENLRLYSKDGKWFIKM